MRTGRLEERSYMTTILQNVAVGESRDRRVQRVARQVAPASVTVTATTWVTELVRETPFPDRDSPGRNLRFPVESDASSIASVSSNGPLPPSSKPTSEAAVNGTADASQKSSSQSDPQWESKMLIAAGVIGLAVVIAVALLVFWRVRNKHKKNSPAGRPNSRNKPKPSLQAPKLENQPSYHPRAPLGRPWSIGPLNPRGAIRDKDQWDVNSSVGSLMHKPTPAFSRAGLNSSPSLLGAQPSRSPFPPPNPMAGSSRLGERNMLFLDTHESQQPYLPSISQTRRASIASSSPVLPIEGPGLASNSPSISGSENGQKRRSSTPSITEISNALAPGGRTHRVREANGRKSSRFSWTNSQAPKTPMDPASRFSIATSVSSVPRHRTVESWVGNQTHRLDDETFHGHLGGEARSKSSEAIINGSPPLNDKSSYEEQGKNGSPASVDYELPKQSNSSPETGSSGRRLHSESRDYGKRQRRKSRLNVPHARDSTAFMVHPGTKVRSPRVSLIPSEILDSKLGHDTL